MTSIASSFAIGAARAQFCLYWQTSDSSTPLKQMPSRDAVVSSRRDSRVNRERFLNQRKDFRPFVGDGNRVFDVRTRLAVDRHHGPAVLQSFRVMGTRINHRL